MAELVSPAGVLPHIPDNLTLAQFILDSHHPLRPIRKHGIPWFIDDHTGRTLGHEEVRSELLLSVDMFRTKAPSRLRRSTDIIPPPPLRYVHGSSGWPTG